MMHFGSSRLVESNERLSSGWLHIFTLSSVYCITSSSDTLSYFVVAGWRNEWRMGFGKICRRSHGAMDISDYGRPLYMTKCVTFIEFEGNVETTPTLDVLWCGPHVCLHTCEDAHRRRSQAMMYTCHLLHDIAFGHLTESKYYGMYTCDCFSGLFGTSMDNGRGIVHAYTGFEKCPENFGFLSVYVLVK